MSGSESPVANGYGQDHHAAASPSDSGAEDADLFGDGDDQDQQDRRLDDSELDSGDDEGRADRVADTVEDGEEEQSERVQYEVNSIQANFARIKALEADELYTLEMPKFLSLQQQNFDYASYEPPTGPHDGQPPTAGFSAYSTATTSIFWRRDPQNPSTLQSNSRIIRWSDGSLTLQIASRPKDQYRISTTALSQRLISKSKPNIKSQGTQPYDPNKDTQDFLGAGHGQSEILQIISPIDGKMRILPTGDLSDESVLKLQQSLAAATNAHDPLTSLKKLKEDPDLARKAAELFEKDRARAIRKRETAEEKLLTRRDRVFGGRSGLGGRSQGLSIAGLEADDDGMPMSRGGLKKSSGAKKRRGNRRGDIYSDDEDEDLPRGRTREDEYDLDDGFMAASDEEPEIFDDGDEEEDPDEDDLEIEGRKTVVEGKTRGGEKDNRDHVQRSVTPKRPGDDDAGPAGSPQARKKRRIVDDDDDDQ